VHACRMYHSCLALPLPCAAVAMHGLLLDTCCMSCVSVKHVL
jgi:hypothetical protein